ncbi:MAG: DUF362 domain-containing protein [Candidatus Heimdallarchaeota archaeon]
MSKVAIVKIENKQIELAVRKAIDLLGGITKFISNEERVLLKPNLLSAPENKEALEKIRTDPRVLEALIKLLMEKRSPKIMVGDCSGVGEKGGTKEAIRKSGYLVLEEKYQNVEVRSLEARGPVHVDINGKKLKSATVAKDVMETKAIINVPKMKTHSLTIFTGAVKNLFGTITGGDKTRIHSLGGTLNGFSQCLVDLYSFEKEKIKLNVMDANVALEGSGPGAAGKAVKMGLILASEDAVALDAVAVTLMGIAPEKVPTLRFAHEQGLGEIDIEKITILGEQIIDHKRKFKFPKSARIAFLPFQRFSKILQRYPKYKSGCINCQSCVKGCPEQVITIITNKKGEPQPRINLKGCIACYTCIEICPEACYGYESRTLRRVILIFSALLVVVAALITFLVLFLR